MNGRYSSPQGERINPVGERRRSQRDAGYDLRQDATESSHIARTGLSGENGRSIFMFLKITWLARQWTQRVNPLNRYITGIGNIKLLASLPHYVGR